MPDTSRCLVFLLLPVAIVWALPATLRSASAHNVAYPQPVFLPVTVSAPFPRAWALLEAPQRSVPVGGMAWCSLGVRGLSPAQNIQLEVAFDASRLAIVDEDPDRPGIQILPGDWPPPELQLLYAMVANNTGILRVSAWTFTEPLAGSATLARFRVRGRYPGAAQMRVVSAWAGPDFSQRDQLLGVTDVTLLVTGTAP